MAIKYSCDRCGDEMAQSSIVTITPEAPVIARSRASGSPIELCVLCGGELRAVLAATRTRPVESEPVGGRATGRPAAAPRKKGR